MRRYPYRRYLFAIFLTLSETFKSSYFGQYRCTDRENPSSSHALRSLTKLVAHRTASFFCERFSTFFQGPPLMPGYPWLDQRSTASAGRFRFHALQSFQISYSHTTVFRSPVVKGVLDYPVFTAQFRAFYPDLSLLDNRVNLFLGKSALLHVFLLVMLYSIEQGFPRFILVLFPGSRSL